MKPGQSWTSDYMMVFFFLLCSHCYHTACELNTFLSTLLSFLLFSTLHYMCVCFLWWICVYVQIWQTGEYNLEKICIHPSLKQLFYFPFSCSFDLSSMNPVNVEWTALKSRLINMNWNIWLHFAILSFYVFFFLNRDFLLQVIKRYVYFLLQHVCKSSQHQFQFCILS